jgi:AraC-like DNA-binding protein
MSLCHLPAKTTHYATVEKGFYMLLYISVRHIAALEHKAIPLALRYIVTQHQRGDISSLIQRNIKMDTPAASIIKKIKSNNLSVIRLSHDLLQGYTARLTTYFSDLPILDSYYLLAIKAKKYIGENLDKRLQISTVAVHFKICKTILKNSFSAVIGQSFHEYVSEVRLQKAHAMLSTGNFRVHEAAAAVGLKEDYLRIPFSKRFGVTPAQFLRIIQAEQLEEALLGEASGTA